jgi:hypothetical protein
VVSLTVSLLNAWSVGGCMAHISSIHPPSVWREVTATCLPFLS